MGIYVYTLRAENKPIKLGHTTIIAHLLKYAFKEFWGTGGTPRYQRATISRAESFWEDKDVPDYVVIGDKFEEGVSVHSEYPDRAWCYDTPNFPGKFVGYLKKEGKQWVVVKDDPTNNS